MRKVRLSQNRAGKIGSLQMVVLYARMRATPTHHLLSVSVWHSPMQNRRHITRFPSRKAKAQQ